MQTYIGESGGGRTSCGIYVQKWILEPSEAIVQSYEPSYYLSCVVALRLGIIWRSPHRSHTQNAVVVRLEHKTQNSLDGSLDLWVSHLRLLVERPGGCFGWWGAVVFALLSSCAPQCHCWLCVCCNLLYSLGPVRRTHSRLYSFGVHSPALSAALL